MGGEVDGLCGVQGTRFDLEKRLTKVQGLV